MNIDISQFHQTFLEEAKEHAVDLESGLLDMDSTDEPDLDAIFRAAHSIKGGAGTFGFDTIAEFTHVVESVLQKCRDGELTPDQDLTTALLKSVDIINALIAAAENNEEADTPEKEECLNTLNGYLDGNVQTSSANGEDGSDAAPATPKPSPDEKMIIEINFTPHAHMPKTGSDPMNIFRELETLGELKPHVKTKDVPPLEELAPDEMHLAWNLELTSDAKEDEVREAFLFVEDDADIDIMILGAFTPPASVNETKAIEQEAQTQEVVVSTPATPSVTPSDDDRRQAERRKNDRRQAPPAKETSFIRVAVDKVDSLINLVGELVTTNAMVEQQSSTLDAEASQKLKASITEMASHTRSLQEGIMAIRMMPIDFAFSRFPRMVRDVSKKLGKEVNLETEGGNTELDKTVIERMTDPLTHLVRNSIDHGLEPPEERTAAGKPAEGTVTLRAYYRGGNVVIEVQDDGRGMSRDKILSKAIEKGLASHDDNLSDDEVFQFIFNSGFSTAAAVTDVSGRGVGMDVVSKNIKGLGGAINIQSEEGQGTCITISLPLTLAILDGMAIKAGNETYIIPLLNIIESIRPSQSDIKTMQDGVEVVDVRGDFLPLLRLHKALHVDEGTAEVDVEKGIAVIIESGQARIALFVDDLLGERQVVIKSIEQNYKTVEGISGATILGDGQVAFILDLAGLVRMSHRDGKYQKEVVQEPEISLEDRIAQEIEKRMRMRTSSPAMSELQKEMADDGIIEGINNTPATQNSDAEPPQPTTHNMNETTQETLQ